MRYFDLLLAAVVVYLPYQQHYPVILELKGLNIVNLGFLALWAAVAMRGGGARTPAPLKRPFIAFFAALALSFAIGQAYDSSRFADDLTVLKNDIFYMLFYFLYYHAVRDEKSIRTVFAAILLVTFLVSLQGVRQALDYGIASFSPSRRVTGPFAGGSVAGANMAAAYYIIFLPVAFTVFLVCKSRPFMRIAGLGIAALGMFAAFFTYSRQAYASLAALFLLQSVRRSLWVGILVVVAVASYEAWVPEAVIERIEMTTVEHAGGDSGDTTLDQSTESRFILWHGAMQLIAEKPWGVGLARFRREIGSKVPAYHNYDAHNGFVLVAAECGVLGVAAMVWLLLRLLLLARKLEKRDASEDTRLMGGAFFVAVVGVVLANLFGSRIFNGEVMANFWILCGLGARYYTLQLEKAAAPAPAAAGLAQAAGPKPAA